MWTRQKYNTLDTPCFCQSVLLGSRSLMFSTPSWEFVRLRVNVSVSPLGLVRRKWKCWKCVFVRRLGVRVEGFKKQKVLGNLSGDHPSYESRRRAEVLLYLHSWGNYKSPEVRTSVSRLSCRLSTSCVFRDICSSVFLEKDRSSERSEWKWFSVIDSDCNKWKWHLFWSSVDSHDVYYTEQKCKRFSRKLTQLLLCLHAWENTQKSQMNTCPEDVQFHISAETFL